MKTLSKTFLACGILGFAMTLQLAAAPDEPKPSTEVSADKEPPSFRFLGGDADRGEASFVALQCIQCHRVAGVELPAPEGKRRLDLEIGKAPRFVKRYEDLILAITNPKHVVTEQYRELLSERALQGEIDSFMPNLANRMTAQQLMDLVAFLDRQFSAEHPEYQSAN